MKFLTHDGLLYFWKKVKNYVDIGLSGKSQTVHTHTTTDITNFPSSLPANGGNADTVDGSHAWQMQTLSNEGGTHGTAHILTCQYTNSEGLFRFKIPDHQIIVNKADYANSASNADTVDGYHVSKGVTAGEFGVRVAQISNVDIGVGAGLSTGELYIVYE